MLNGLKPLGSLLECFMSFPQFRDDLEILAVEGFLKVTSSETYEWLKSKTSLAEYFKWAGSDADWVPGGFWAPIEVTLQADEGFSLLSRWLRKGLPAPLSTSFLISVLSVFSMFILLGFSVQSENTRESYEEGLGDICCEGRRLLREIFNNSIEDD